MDLLFFVAFGGLAGPFLAWQYFWVIPAEAEELARLASAGAEYRASLPWPGESP